MAKTRPRLIARERIADRARIDADARRIGGELVSEWTRMGHRKAYIARKLRGAVVERMKPAYGSRADWKAILEIIARIVLEIIRGLK